MFCSVLKTRKRNVVKSVSLFISGSLNISAILLSFKIKLSEHNFVFKLWYFSPLSIDRSKRSIKVYCFMLVNQEMEDRNDANKSEKVEPSMSDAEILGEQKNSSVFSKHPNLEDIRQLQAKFVHERNWEQYHEPRNLLLALVGEVGELSEIFQWRGEVKAGLPDWTPEDKEHLGQELSDVLLYLIRLSEKCAIDLPAAVIKKIALNSEKYPVSKVWGSDKKYTSYQDDS